MKIKIRAAIVVIISFLLCVISYGIMDRYQNQNECPEVIPAIQEWEAGYGVFVPRQANIVISGREREKMKPIAEQLKKEYEEITGMEMSIKEGNKLFLKAGDIYLGFSSEKRLQKEESYVCEIKNKIVIESNNAEGIFWGTRTLLQMLVKNSQEIVQGTIYDFPEYEVRGLGIDVARHPMSIDSLKILIQVMSYYKMNDLHLHLNDNELLGYSNKLESAEQSLAENYSAFRLESDVVNDSGEKITSEDYYYSTENFRELVSYASGRGVMIVPEIDTPAHSLAITKRFPELCNYSEADHVDVLNIKDGKTYEVVSNIWEHALTEGLKECEVVHMGLDESFFGSNDYADYANSMISLGHENNRKVRIWGSMTELGCIGNIISENVQVNIWRTSWANPKQVFGEGFGLINTISQNLYIIPAGGYDYLDNEYIYNTFEPNKFEVDEIIYEAPKDHEQMLGASMFVWNDFCGTIDMGISEYDIIDRVLYSLPYFAQKVWGSNNELGYDEFGEVIHTVKNIPDCKLYQTPEKSGVIYPPYEIKFQLTADGKNTVLFENETEYGRNALIINEDGYLQYLTEFREYRFNYVPKAGDEIVMIGEMGITSLGVNGELLEQIGTNNISELHGTFVFPITANENMIDKNTFSYIKN